MFLKGASASDGTMICRGYEVPEIVTLAMQFCCFFKLDKNATFSFVMTPGLASDSDKFMIIIMLCRVHKFGDTGLYKNLDFFC